MEWISEMRYTWSEFGKRRRTDLDKAGLDRAVLG